MTISTQGLNDIPTQFRKYENSSDVNIGTSTTKDFRPPPNPQKSYNKPDTPKSPESNSVGTQQQNNINDTLFAVLLLMLFMD